MSFQFSDGYEDPLKEGDDFRRLVLKIDRKIKFPKNTAAYQDQLNEINEWMTGYLSYKPKLQYVYDFMSKVLIPGGINCNLIEVFGVEEIVEMQSNVAPICNLEDKDGIIQFGSWCGDFSDGDAWCLDLNNDLIMCVPVASGDSAEKARRDAYAKLPNFSYFADYLASSAKQRGWLKGYKI